MFNKISAILVIILAIAMLALLFTACTTESDNNAVTIPNRFVEIDADLNGYAPDFDSNKIYPTHSTYVVDRYSKVVYLYYYDGGNNSGADFITLYNPDGTVLIYDGQLPD